MTNNKQQTAVDIIYQGISDKIVMQDLSKALICIHISHDDLFKLHRQAKEIEHDQQKKTWNDALNSVEKKLELIKQTYGGNK